MNVHSTEMNTRRLTGMGAVATLALAVLVFGCVLAATAGPREVLKTRTDALQQALAPIPPLARSITVTTTWSQFLNAAETLQLSFTDRQLSKLGDQFYGDFRTGALRHALASGHWLGMTTSEQTVQNALPGTGGLPVEMELSYRLPLAGYVQVLAGSLSTAAPAASRDNAGYFPTINVAVTQQTADRFGLRVGSAVRTIGPVIAQYGAAPQITLKVAAIVAESQPTSAFWEAVPALAKPELNVPGNTPPYWAAGVFALPDETAAVQQDYGQRFLTVQWVFPMNFGGLPGDQAQPLVAALNSVVNELPRLTGPLAGVATVVTVSTGVLPALSAFTENAAAVDALLWLLYVSLALIGVVVLLLAARMIVLRRGAELALCRARGASLLQIGLTAGRGALIGCVPAAAVAAAVAVLLVPGQAPPGGWWPGIAVLVVAVIMPVVLAAWQQRSARNRRGVAAGGYARPGQAGVSQPSLGYGALNYARRGRRRFRGGVRPVVEVTAALAAIAGVVVFRQEVTQPSTAVDIYTSAAPALVAIPAVIVVMRIYPLILRGVLRRAARGRSAAGFLGLTRIARAKLTPALPAFALVLAITVAAFAGMVRDAVTRGEVNASWQAAGADLTISTVGPAAAIPVAAQHAFAAVAGVAHTAVASEWTETGPHGASVTAIAVDPASYSALVASSQTWPAIHPSLLTGDSVLASRQALAEFSGARAVTLNNGIAPIRVRIAGTLSGTPALTGGGAFVLMPESLVAHDAFVVPNLMLLNGPGIDTRKLTALVSKKLPAATSTVRSQLLQQLTSAPLQRGALLLFALALAVAAGLGLAVMLLQLALGAADREATLARLATMGLGERQRAELVLLEVLPAVIAAAVAAVAAALVLPPIVAPAINLSVFTGSSAGVPLVPDVPSFVLPIAGLIVVAAVALTIEIRARRSVVSTLRGGD
jgi:putative ABC transport system permease protein